MAAREFHFQDGPANKFWTIELAAKSYTVHFGRMGTAGQTQTKEFGSEAAAQAAHDKLVAEKIKKGYKEVSGSQAGTPTPARAALEAGAKPEETKKPAAKLAHEGRAEPLLSHVSKRMQKLFTEHPPYSRFAKLSIKEWLAICWNFKAFYQSAYVYRQTDQEIAQMVASRTTGAWKKWSADHVKTAFAFLTLAENTIGGETGIVRRIQREDPAELAIAEALDQRLYWISIKLNELATGRMGYSWTGYGLAPRHHLLRALAVGDPHWAQRLADYDYSGTAEDLGDEDRAILAAHRRDMGALRAQLPRGRVDKYEQWRWDCLRGIAANDPEQVQAALQKELDRNRSSRAAMEEAGFGIVNLVVHGYYRLGEHVSPELVAHFDARQSFPWDVDFHEWVEAHKNPLAGLDLSDISPVLHDALVLLKTPAWWTNPAESGRPKDVGAVLGPGRAEQTADAEEPESAAEYGLGSLHDEMLPIATNLAEVEGAIGSGNTALVNLLVEKFKDDIASDDQFIADRLDEGIMPDEDEADEEMGEPPSAVSIAELLRCLVMGEKLAGPVPYRYMYGCALRYLALHFGEVLPHDQWNDFSARAFGTIDKALGAAGIPAKVLSLERLVDRAGPIAAIPEYHDGLRVGYLRRLEIDQALAALAAAKRDRMDEDLAVFVDDIHEWLRACADSKRDLLCFSTH